MANDKDLERLKKRIAETREKADRAFWAEVAKGFPEIKTGDFGPDETFAWEDAMDDAIYSLLFWNHPNHELIERAEAEKYRRAL